MRVLVSVPQLAFTGQDTYRTMGLLEIHSLANILLLPQHNKHKYSEDGGLRKWAASFLYTHAYVEVGVDYIVLLRYVYKRNFISKNIFGLSHRAQCVYMFVCGKDTAAYICGQHTINLCLLVICVCKVIWSFSYTLCIYMFVCRRGGYVHLFVWCGSAVYTGVPRSEDAEGKVCLFVSQIINLNLFVSCCCF